MIVNLTSICSEINYDKFEITEFDKWSPTGLTLNNQLITVISYRHLFMLISFLIYLIIISKSNQEIHDWIRQIERDQKIHSDLNGALNGKIRMSCFFLSFVIYIIFGFFNKSKIVTIKNQDYSFLNLKGIFNGLKKLFKIKKTIFNLIPILLIIIVLLLYVINCYYFFTIIYNEINEINGNIRFALLGYFSLIPILYFTIRYDYEDLNLEIPTVEELEQYLKENEKGKI